MITTADIFSLPNHQTKKDQDNALVNKNTQTLHCKWYPYTGEIDVPTYHLFYSTI